MSLFLYIDHPTALHRLNPIVKVLGMLCFFVAAFVTQAPAAALPVAVAMCGLITAARAWRNVWRLRVLFVMVFIMTFIIWTLFFRGGVPFFSWGPLHVSTAALRFALGMAIKLDTFLGVGIVFLSTTKIEEFAYALTRVGMPYKLGFTMTLAFRLVPVFLDSAATVVQAQRCRGFNFDEGNLLQRMRRYVPVIVPVFMGALRRADGMAMALEARGFQANTQRSTFEHFTFRRSDALALLMAIAVAVAYVVLASFGYTSVPAA